MKYIELAEIYKKLESTSKSLIKTSYVAELLRNTKSDDLEKITLLLQGKLFPPWNEHKIGVASRLILKTINIATGIPVNILEEEWKKTGDLGKVAEHFVEKKKQITLFTQSLTVEKVFNNLRKLAELEGAGTVDKKIQLMAELITSAKPIEARYIIRTILSELRIGVGAGVLRDGIVCSEFPVVVGLPYAELAETKGKVLKIKSPDDLDRDDLQKYSMIEAEDPKLARHAYKWLADKIQGAYDLTNDFSIVARQARTKGINGLNEIKLEPGRPIRVMLAQKAGSVKEGFERVGSPAAIEYKYDGFRMQVHGFNKKVIIYTRSLENVTNQFPEVVEYIKKNIKAKSFILDGEAVGFEPKTNKYLPFQSISQRIKRKHNIAKMSKSFPVELNVFDIVYLDGKDLIKTEFKERRRLLEKILPEKSRSVVLAKQLIFDNEKEAKGFYMESLKNGMEGVMFKNLEAPYMPGSRVGFMVKLKPIMESLDLVIVGAEWGKGKRANWLTSFTLACIDENSNFLEIGKVSTGLKELESQGVSYAQMTELLRPLIIAEKGRDIRVKLEIVIEVNYEEIQKSPMYSSGYALRFPRFICLRDRLPEDISNLEMVREFYNSQRKN